MDLRPILWLMWLAAVVEAEKRLACGSNLDGLPLTRLYRKGAAESSQSEARDFVEGRDDLSVIRVGLHHAVIKLQGGLIV